DNSLMNADLDGLLSAAWFAGLQSLNLARNRLSSPVARRLANLRLQHLVLDSNDICCVGVTTCEAHGSLPQPRRSAHVGRVSRRCSRTRPDAFFSSFRLR